MHFVSAFRSVASVCALMSLFAACVAAAPPTMKARVSLAAAANLFVPNEHDSIEAQAKALGFDSIEPSLMDLTRIGTTRPTPSTNPNLADGVAFAIRMSTHHYASLNVGTLTSLSDDPLKLEPSLFLNMAQQFHATMVLPISMDDLSGANRDHGIEQLRLLGKLAADKQTTVALDLPLGVDEWIALIDAVGSPMIKCAFDPIKISAAHNDPYQAFRLIGHARIAQVRITSRINASLKDDLTQLPVLREALDDTGWSGWIVLQPENGQPLNNDRLRQDAAYLHSVFVELKGD